jgi:S-adenosylmethionine synthetase
MKLHVSNTKIEPSQLPFEIVERKGIGHPDTLADHLAEHLSRTYSNYTKERFGAVLRHQFDKVTLMCGRCKVAFGEGELLEPIRVLLNGRASARLGDEEIPLREMLFEATYAFFADRFPMIDPRKDLRILFEVRHGLHSTTGGIFGDALANAAAIHYRFHPRTLADLPETHCVESNDTSLGCCFAPFSPLERLVLALESELSGQHVKDMWPWIGSDIKIMSARHEYHVSLVLAVPILSSLTRTPSDYFERLRLIEERVNALTAEITPEYSLARLIVNSGDDVTGRKVYMNFTGSSIESGDEGQVGRGNRIGGFIAPARPFTMEGICGKNPVYHVGKVYSVAALAIATRLYEKYGISCNVFLINRMAQPLNVPWYSHIEVTKSLAEPSVFDHVTNEVLQNLGDLTEGILQNRYPLA